MKHYTNPRATGWAALTGGLAVATGMLAAANWSAFAPGKAILAGILGILTVLAYTQAEKWGTR